MRRLSSLLAALTLGLATGAAAEPAPSEGREVILDTASLSFQQSKRSDAKMLSDIDREAAQTIMRINRTRGTWQSYLLYTTPEMKVPALRPGFTFTLPPPSRQELEKRRRRMAEAEKAAAQRGLQPSPGAAPGP